MNWAKGFFRAWIVLSVFWIAACATIIAMTKPFANHYSYVYMMKKDAKTWSDMEAPDRSKTPEFHVLDYKYWETWDKDIAEGRSSKKFFEDGSVLYLSNQILSASDRDFLVAEFWSQRFLRWAKLLGPGLLWMLVPPLALLFAGACVRWILVGFRH